jgi:hypothetical protein
MLRGYAMHFSQRRAQPGLLSDHAVAARAIFTGTFRTWDFLYICRGFDIAGRARKWRRRFLGSHCPEQLALLAAS